MPAPWNSFSACLLARSDRIGGDHLDLLNQSHVNPLGLCALCALSSVICHLLSALCRLKLVLRLDVGRWSSILRVQKIIKNRGLTPDDKK